MRQIRRMVGKSTAMVTAEVPLVAAAQAEAGNLNHNCGMAREIINARVILGFFRSLHGQRKQVLFPDREGEFFVSLVVCRAIRLCVM